MSQEFSTSGTTASRRNLLLGSAIAVAGTAATLVSESASAQPVTAAAQRTSYIAMKDGTQIYYKDWGAGPVVVFSHGWPLSSDAWEDQMLFLTSNGYTNIGGLRRDTEGIWRTKAVKADLALDVAVDIYCNVETQPANQGGLAQASPSE